MHDTLAPPATSSPDILSSPIDAFLPRHLGPDQEETAAMLATLGYGDFGELIEAAVPRKIRIAKPLQLPAAAGEHEALREIRAIAAQNRVCKSYLGEGYHDCITPPVIQRNILEDPGWYTAYTPYQAEISQGRLEALINFQQMIIDLTGLDIANASLLDEATAAAEAMHMAHAASKTNASAMFVSKGCHPQTIAVVKTRAAALGIDLLVGDERTFSFDKKNLFAVLLQYPDTFGRIADYAGFIDRAHQAGALAIVAADILALTVLRPPGEFGADIAVGSTQRFGVPLGFGGPHAAYMATRDAHKRLMPGRLVGVSKDAHGHPAYRLSLQTREQHIRRDKATSNICTAQVLLAVMASMYAVYHGPRGLRRIAERVHRMARLFATAARGLGFSTPDDLFFDTVTIRPGADSSPGKLGSLVENTVSRAAERGINLRTLPENAGWVVAFDETTTLDDLAQVLELFGGKSGSVPDLPALAESTESDFGAFIRNSDFLTHPVFNRYHTETELLRYIRRLGARDISLTASMIPLGSCTMKLNATSEMLPLSWPEFSRIHPFAPADQTKGYALLCAQLEKWLAEITGFAAVSLEPNAGSQGEYAGLLVIQKYHQSRGEGHRRICLIPVSAHGTNPASAVMAGMEVVPVNCAANGDVDLNDLRAKAAQHAGDLSALMVTYPSTHGVFEEGIIEICEIVHAHGGQVYMDGANMNAQVGLTSPGRIGADVCHLNLHKTFCIPHGGGGPGMGPIAVAQQLVSFLPSTISRGSDAGRVGPVSAAPYGSGSILTIPWVYIRMMGAAGLTQATQVAILNANYIARRLDRYFPVLFKGRNGLVAHECIIDLRAYRTTSAEDAAKRLIDYGFHAPTLSWPVPGTLMIEPTESESKEELDRFCDAMIAIHGEMTAVERGDIDPQNNPLKNAPHTARAVTASSWDRPYSRETAAFPAAWLDATKFWPPVGRIDNVYGDRNLFCGCVPMASSEN